MNLLIEFINRILYFDLNSLNKSPFPVFLIIAFTFRVLLLVYGYIHDSLFRLKYTDIDYLVFTEAAVNVCYNYSPYDVDTYRYTPLLAWLLLPNCIYQFYGKLLFILIDTLYGYFIYYYLALVDRPNQDSDYYMIKFASCFWLFNPFNSIISSRGNAECLISTLVILTFIFIMQDRHVIAGITYGIAVHLKIYPIIFAISIYLYIGNCFPLHTNTNEKKISLYNYCTNCILFSRKQLEFIIAFSTSFISLCLLFYCIYGYDFLQNTYFHHFTRTDVSHNFSPYFYLFYLSQTSPFLPILGLLVFIPQALLTLIVGLTFYRDLAFASFLQIALFTTFNKVVTSQYFLWYLSLLPLLIPQCQLHIGETSYLMFIWLLGQAIWLLPAYFYEFVGYSTYPVVWLAGLLFFAINCKIVVKIIKAHAYRM